jgi:tetratricopeptide (TPR) repeat protein
MESEMNLVVALLITFTFANQTTYEEKIKGAKECFYEDRYAEAERLVMEARTIDPTDPESYELRTTIILFRLKHITGIEGAREEGNVKETKKTLTACALCPGLVKQFENDAAEGTRLARQVLVNRPDDERATFLLAKIALNKLWLNLQILDKLEGWREYKEARKFLAKVLARNPNHVRALTASGWINYIVAQRNLLVRAVLGGGSKKTALKQVRQAASCGRCAFFDRIEARFSLLDMLKQEKSFAEAVVLAKELSVRFPENASLIDLIGQKTVPP